MSSQPTSSSSAALVGRLEASIMAESALIDKETGRVYWEGGSSSTLSASLIPKVSELGLSHLKSTVLTSLLLLALVSFVAQWIRQRVDASTIMTGESPITISRSVFRSVSLFILQWTLLKTPRFDGTFVVCIFLLYLLEAHTCSTRRFLANAITSPDEVEGYLEKLRNEAPIVTWKVRCFHYEKPYWLTPIRTAQKLWNKIVQEPIETPEQMEVPSEPGHVVPKESDNVSGPFRRKVVSHYATANYTFYTFLDDTMAGVWNRQISTSSQPAPFMKIVLSKILVLANSRARDDYFKQQSNFVTREGMKDKFAEYSTNIEVPGFKRRMLAIRPVVGTRSSKLFRLNTFWLFTLLGMSLPYRIWFSTHCDQLRVTVVKETYTEPVSRSTFSSWFTTKPTPPTIPSKSNAATNFRQQMQSLLLYSKAEEELSKLATNKNSTVPVPDSDKDDSQAQPQLQPTIPIQADKIASSNTTKLESIVSESDKLLADGIEEAHVLEKHEQAAQNLTANSTAIKQDEAKAVENTSNVSSAGNNGSNIDEAENNALEESADTLDHSPDFDSASSSGESDDDDGVMTSEDRK